MRRAGLTLIEVIISVLIFSIVIVVIYSAFNMGMKTWQRSKEEKSLQKIRLSFLKIEKELKDSFYFSKVPFDGKRNSMSFPFSVSGVLYVATYSIDEDEETGLKYLARKERIFSETGDEDKESIRILLSSIKDIDFEYAHKKKGFSDNFEWHDVWDGVAQAALPFAVRVSLQKNDRDEVYNKVVFLRYERFEVE